jgi:hypothetical protein
MIYNLKSFIETPIFCKLMGCFINKKITGHETPKTEFHH